jgi:hypothetical protein
MGVIVRGRDGVENKNWQSTNEEGENKFIEDASNMYFVRKQLQ